MNRLKHSAFVLLIGASSVVLGAQAPAADKPVDTKAPAPTMAAASTSVTMTGCVTKAGGEHFRLTNAKPATSDVAQPAGTTGAPTLDAPSSMDRPTSYAITGKDLKDHVGHQVELTGTTAPAHDTGVAKPASTPVIGTTPTIDVTSIKMISARCS